MQALDQHVRIEVQLFLQKRTAKPLAWAAREEREELDLLVGGEGDDLVPVSEFSPLHVEFDLYRLVVIGAFVCGRRSILGSFGLSPKTVP